MRQRVDKYDLKEDEQMQGVVKEGGKFTWKLQRLRQ
jgi:hypothetical protein